MIIFEMSKIATEEKSPLLFVEDKYDENPKSRKVHFENSRFKEIYSGATTVFMHFPDYTGTCWIITAFCGLTFFMMMLLLVGTITTTSLRVPRCIPADEQSNKTIALVYPFDSNSLKSQEFQIIDKILKTYDNYKIHLIFIRRPVSKANSIYQLLNLSEIQLKLNSTPPPMSTPTTKTGKKKEIKRKKKMSDYRLSVDIEARKLLDMLLHGKITDDKLYTEKVQVSDRKATTAVLNKTTNMSINELIKQYPNMIIENITFNQVFFNSPLYGYWSEINDDLKLFAVRVLHLWQNGGISFDLQPSISKTVENKNGTNNTKENINIQKIMKFITTGKNKFESLPENVVVADDEGLHMMSKIPCHVFFGQILTNLRKAKKDTTVSDVLKSSIAVFCRNYAAERKYCDKLLSS